MATLQRNLEDSNREAARLQAQMEMAEIKLVRAERLLNGLSGESVRWKQSVGILEQDLFNLTGNIMLACATIAYLGPFN